MKIEINSVVRFVLALMNLFFSGTSFAASLCGERPLPALAVGLIQFIAFSILFFSCSKPAAEAENAKG